MNQMEIFKNPEFGSIRVIEENGKYLFCGTDVAAALGYSNSRDLQHRREPGTGDFPLAQLSEIGKRADEPGRAGSYGWRQVHLAVARCASVSFRQV